MKQLTESKKGAWLYHPGLVDSQRGQTGKYRPAGLDTLTKTPLIELEIIYERGSEPFVVMERSEI